MRKHGRVRYLNETATCSPGNLVENLGARVARPKQKRLNRNALQLRLSRRGMRSTSAGLAIGEEHDHARRVWAPVFLEFGKRRKNSGAKIRAAGAGQIPQRPHNPVAVRRHGLSEFTLVIKADNTNLDVTFRRKVPDQADGPCRPKIVRIGAAQTLRRIHYKDHVEVTYAADSRRDTLHLDSCFSFDRGKVGGR